MLYVPIGQLQPGMVVAKAVSQTRNKVSFVQRGYSLDRRAIARLKDLGVAAIWIECDGVDEVADKINDVVVERRQDLTCFLLNTTDAIQQGRGKGKLLAAHFQSKVGALLDEIMDDPTHEPIVSGVGADCGLLIPHLTNCCYLCLLLGTHLSGYVRDQRKRMSVRMAEDVRELGIGAYVHDLGKVQLSDKAQKTNALSRNAADAEYRSHVTKGAELFRGEFSSLVVYMVTHHHQRYDGKGFPVVQGRAGIGEPRGLAGDRIHIFARILSAVNVFDHLLGTPDAPRPTIQALSTLRQMQIQGWFDPVIVAALIRLVPPFMVGSVVELDDGRPAVVVCNNAEAPCSPTIQVISGKPGVAGASKVGGRIDLRDTKSTTIAKVNGVDIAKYHFEPPPISEGELAAWGLRSKAVRAAQIDMAEALSSNT